jgi:hypothetical protein
LAFAARVIPAAVEVVFMFGFVIGSLCLVGLAVVVARGRHHHHGRFRHRRGGRRVLFEVLDRLDATPGQEKAIRSALDDFAEAVKPLKSEITGVRESVASALREDALDHTALSQAYAHQDAAISKLRAETTRLFERVHETLDARQRERLSSLVESEHPFWLMHHRCA